MSPNDSPDGSVPTRPRAFLVAQDAGIAPMSAGPLDFDWVVEQLRADPDVVVERELRPRGFTLANAGPSITRTVIAATMPDAVRDELVRHPQIVVEEDHPVLPQLGGTGPDLGGDPQLVSPFGASTSWRLTVTGPDGAPVPDATVYLYGSGVPAQGRTDATGTVTVSLRNESDDTLRALYVNPLRDYWSLWVSRPALTAGASNAVVLQALSDSFAGFPQRQLLGWGQKLMRLDEVPAAMDGRGVSVAVIDSGAAALTHDDLRRIVSGADLTGDEPGSGRWTQDVIAHGSHCSGVIAGTDDGRGVRGFAPAADLHELRIFPGGRMSSLLDAVDYCIEQGMDVVNMSLGAGGVSQIMLQKLAQAREQGVACIVAAGNSGDAVQFPGLSPDVLTVAAIGKEGTFPGSSYHAQQPWKGGVSDGGLFSAQFSCHGPEIDVCGPGVAIVSSVPDNGYAAWDGTSMATPHIAGLAALVLAHHPDFRTPQLRLRTAARVDRLFEILKASATPLAFGDPHRSGAGVPDAVRALGLEAGAGAPIEAPPQAAVAVRLAIEQLRADAVAAGLMPDEAVRPMSLAGPLARDARAETARRLWALRAELVGSGLLPA